VYFILKDVETGEKIWIKNEDTDIRSILKLNKDKLKEESPFDFG